MPKGSEYFRKASDIFTREGMAGIVGDDIEKIVQNEKGATIVFVSGDTQEINTGQMTRLIDGEELPPSTS